MGEATVLTGARISEIADGVTVDGRLDVSNNLVLTRNDGTEFQASSVQGPEGYPGAPGGLLSSRPVGSIYISSKSRSPATLFGGVWEKFGEGRTLVGVDDTQSEFDTVEKVGGEKEHELTVDELPSHFHSINHNHEPFSTDDSDGGHKHYAFSARSNASGAANSVKRNAAGAGSGGYGPYSPSGAHPHTIDVPEHSGSTGEAGSGEAHNNLQPFKTFHMWKRTA